MTLPIPDATIPLKALFRHRLSLRGDVEVIVQPNDGRYPETFRAHKAELRRFAWSLLADLDPEEASRAAAESGVDLSLVIRRERFEPQAQRRNAGKGAAAPPGIRTDTDTFAALQLLGDGAPHSVLTLRPRLEGAPTRAAGKALYELRRRGLATRVDEGGQGLPGTFIITPLGRQALEVSTPSQPERSAA